MHNARFRQTSGMIFDDMDGQFTVYHPQQGQFFALNRSGVQLWETLTDWVEVTALEAMLVSRFNAPPKAAQTDARRFLETLEERGLVERSTSMTGSVAATESAAA
jgi:PqqD family protein of HPr-rel-A system